jgi:hypothetical protein
MVTAELYSYYTVPYFSCRIAWNRNTCHCAFSVLFILCFTSHSGFCLFQILNWLKPCGTISAAFNLLLLVKTEQDVFKTTQNFLLATYSNAKSISIHLYPIWRSYQNL